MLDKAILWLIIFVLSRDLRTVWVDAGLVLLHNVHHRAMLGQARELPLLPQRCLKNAHSSLAELGVLSPPLTV